MIGIIRPNRGLCVEAGGPFLTTSLFFTFDTFSKDDQATERHQHPRITFFDHFVHL